MGSDRHRSPLTTIATFTAAVLGLSCPFWLAGYWLGGVLLPGLPLSALMAVVPALAALVLSARNGGLTEAWRLAARVADICRADPAIVALAGLLMPALTFGAWVWMTASGISMPSPDISSASLAGLFVVFLAAAFGEELGWSAYLAKPAVQYWGFIGAGLAIGTFTALWHFVPLLQAGRDWDWIGWWALGTIAARLIALAIYRWSNESVFAVSTLHAAQNVAWQAFPANGSHFDPKYTAPVFLLAAVACTAVELRRRRVGR